jgi:outer membrane protein TolC
MPFSAPRRRTFAAVGLWLAVATGLPAQPGDLPPPQPVPFASDPVEVLPAPAAVGPVTRYTLAEALRVAHASHPYLAASRASLNAAFLKQRGLGEVKRTTSIASGLFIPDYEVRMQQSDLGLKAAMIELAQWEHEVTYAVVRSYYTIVYARMQQKVARDLVEQLEVNMEQVKRILEGKGGARQGGVTANSKNQLQVVLSEARQRLIQAEVGADRARAALREAMGLDPMCQVDVVDDVVPDIKVPMIPLDTIKAHAVTRRGEVLLTEIGADVTRLEVCAQWARKMTLMAYTYANATDIHARPIPAGERDPDYKPGAIGPEMPDRLIGKASTRAATADQYAQRMAESARQARSLVALEAHVAWTRWLEASRKVKEARVAAQAGRELVERLREAAGGVLSKEDIILSEVSSTRAFAALNEALYEQISALANLERITAGGIRVDHPGRSGR